MSLIKAERTAEADQAAAAATAAVEQVEGEIRAFVRRDLSVFRRKQQEGGEAAVETVTSVIDRVSGASVTEIERVMSELASVRDSAARASACSVRSAAMHRSARRR